MQSNQGEMRYFQEAKTLGKIYNSPADLLQLLNLAVNAAAKTNFYSPLIPTGHWINSLEDFKQIPVTRLSLFRQQKLSDIVPNVEKLQWVVGAYKGQLKHEVAIVESTVETAIRYDLFKDAIVNSTRDLNPKSAATITSPNRRYFAAEICSIFGYLGIPAHVLIDDGSTHALEQLHKLSPSIFCILTDDIDESNIPSSVSLCVTFRRSHLLTRFRQLDMYIVDEFGFLGHTTDLNDWILYNDQYLFEEGDDQKLVVTALHNLTQPLIRLETHDTYGVIHAHKMSLRYLCNCG